MTRVHQESMINLHHNRSSDLEVFISLPFSPSHVLAIIISYIPFESLKSQNSSCETILKCVTIETVLHNVLAGSSPLAAVILQNVLRSFRIKTLYNLDKIHIVGNVWVSKFHIWWLFCYRCNIEREIDRFVTKMHIKNFWMAPGGCFWYDA